MSTATASDGLLSIGEVLHLLRPDFPDVSISKIRYLEAEGLVEPSRTPSGYRKFTRADAERFLDGARTANVFGTMWHGSLESDAFRTAFLTEVAACVGKTFRPSGVSFEARREARLDLLGDLVESKLDVDALLALAHEGTRRTPFPSLPPGP